MSDQAFKTALQRFLATDPTDAEVVAFASGYNAGCADLMVRQCAAYERHFAGDVVRELEIHTPEVAR